jgi:ribosomal protein S18 acetylase RimI-like enzyme
MVTAFYKKRSFLSFLFASALIGGGINVGWYYLHRPVAEQQILDFDYERDAQSIIEAFARDRYWLTANPAHSTEYVLRNRASSEKITHLGNLTIKVAYDHGTYAGMVAYFKKKFYVGKILYLVVEPEFRSKGWGYRLLDYAMKDLAQRGALRIHIVTRPQNTAANKLYERYGFKETERDDMFVAYEYYPEQSK